MTRTPLISVSMITYNHAPYIARAIEGVLMQQTDFAYELVIGEDCSTDGTREIVFRYAQLNPDVIRVVTAEKNVGANQNGRRTLAACRGTYIAWCEGDDYWHRRDKLQLQVAYLEANRDCGFVYSDCDCHDVLNDRHIASLNEYRDLRPPEDPTLLDLLHSRCGILTCTVCARLDLVKSTRASDPELYDSDRFLMGDTPLWAGLMSQARVHYFPDSLATYNILPESASHSRFPARKHRFIASNNEMRVYVAKKYGLPAEEIRQLEKDYSDAALFFAFIDCDEHLARAGWNGLERPTLRQRLLFWGAQGTLRNRVLRAALTSKRAIGEGVRTAQRVLHLPGARDAYSEIGLPGMPPRSGRPRTSADFRSARCGASVVRRARS
jgi:hypothetical protein